MAEIMLHLPHAKENLKYYFSNADMTCSPMKWFFLARAAAFEKDYELMDEIQYEISRSARYPDKRSEAWILDALGYITRGADFDSTKKQKDAFHDMAIVLRENGCRWTSSIDQLIIMYETMNSWQSKGYANAHIGTNGSVDIQEKREHLSYAKDYHQNARIISEEIRTKLSILYSREQFGQSDVVTCLEFDGMLRTLRLMQTQDLIISRDPSRFNLKKHENIIQNCVDRISYNLAASNIRDAHELRFHLEAKALELKRAVVRGEINGILINHPACSE